MALTPTIGVAGGDHTFGLVSISGVWSNLWLKFRLNPPLPRRRAKILPS
jgi:hypothetical protein